MERSYTTNWFREGWIYTLLLLACAYVLVRFGLPLLVDDGYYYLQIAWNAANGHGLTFDGLNHTNGFHPLWEAMLIPLFLFGTSKVLCAYLAVSLQTVLFVGSGVILVRTYRDIGTHVTLAWFPGVIWLLNPWILNKGALSGMETGLYLFLVALSYSLFLKYWAGTTSGPLIGVVLMLTIAARIDGIGLLLAIAAVMLLHRRPVKDLLTITGPTLVYLTLYLSFNVYYCGHPLPISGYRRSYEAQELLAGFLHSGDTRFITHALENARMFMTLGNTFPLPLSIAILLGGVWMLTWLHRRLAAVGRILVLVHCTYSALLIGYYLCFYQNALNATTYYWLPVAYGIVLLGSILLSTIKSRSTRIVLRATVLAAMGVFSFLYAYDMMNTFSFLVPPDVTPTSKGVRYINTGLPTNAIIGSWDAGYVGYFSDRPVINLDGLVNNYELFEYERQGRLAEYIIAKHITHLANANFFIGQKEWIEQRFAGTLVFDDSLRIEKAITRFTVSSDTRRYGVRTTNEFFIYSIEGRR